jgi:hypothetical protein
VKNSKSQGPIPTKRIRTSAASQEIPVVKDQTRITVPGVSLAACSQFIGVGFWCLMFLVCPCAHAQTYSIDWYKVAGGGGTSTGGVYSISGTIGQADAGKMSGGTYTLDGGFWGIIGVIQTPGAPLLKILRTSTNTVIVSWPVPSTGFNLQQNTDLSTANWVAPAEMVNSDGTTKFVIVSQPTGKRFYRLKSP